MEQVPTPTTLLAAVTTFSNTQVAHDYFVALRWPNGIACPRMGCGSANVARIKGRNAWRCRECDRQFTAKVGTIFEDSPIGFDKWLPAMWMLSADRNGVSSYEVARGLGVTQKTAWFMLHRLRLAMRTNDFDRLSGEVEADETYIGGKTRRGVPKAVRIGKAGKQAKQDAKAVVMGMRERGGRVRAKVVADNRKTTLLPMLFQHVERGSVLYTDALKSYADAREAFVHEVIRPLRFIRLGPRPYEQHRKLLERLETHARRDVHRAASLPPRRLPGRASVSLQRAHRDGRAALCEGAQRCGWPTSDLENVDDFASVVALASGSRCAQRRAPSGHASRADRGP
jgi:transposase-like protein